MNLTESEKRLAYQIESTDQIGTLHELAMLSLPENWDYTTRGLAKICKDGVDSICSAVNELEEHGYVRRERMYRSNC